MAFCSIALDMIVVRTFFHRLARCKSEDITIRFESTHAMNWIQRTKANHGLESTGAPPAAETPETHP